MTDNDPYEFGGSERQIRRIQRRFLRYFDGHGPVLDVGCGRGIFLSLLREAGIPARGIDVYSSAVALCREAGYDVSQDSALEFLEVHENRFGGIFCSHVIEHLSFDSAALLIRRCAGALVPGGIAVFVTPNPRDIGIMGETFWLDPSHVRPYPVPLLRSMSEAAGMHVESSGTFHGGLPRREIPRFIRYRLTLGQYYGAPNAFLAARRQAP